MLKVLDVTVRMVEYTDKGVILPYIEHRVVYEFTSLPESLQAKEDDLVICRYVAENCLSMEPLLPKD